MQYWAGKVAGACCAENFRGEFGSVGLSLSWLVSWKAGVSIGCMPLLQNQKKWGNTIWTQCLFFHSVLLWHIKVVSQSIWGQKKEAEFLGKSPVRKETPMDQILGWNWWGTYWRTGGSELWYCQGLWKHVVLLPGCLPFIYLFVSKPSSRYVSGRRTQTARCSWKI